jgi:hypothetical protein
VERTQYRWDKQKPNYKVQFAVLEPKQFVGTSLPARLYCTAKALWKLSWFLRDFGYDIELLGRDELEEKRLDFRVWSRSPTPSSTTTVSKLSLALSPNLLLTNSPVGQ